MRIQGKEYLIEHDSLRLLASSFEHEIRTVFTKQPCCLVDEIALLGVGAQVYGSIPPIFRTFQTLLVAFIFNSSSMVSRADTAGT
jgi:hypothetical protein